MSDGQESADDAEMPSTDDDARPPMGSPTSVERRYHAQVKRIVDGDTVDVLCDLDFNTWRKVRLRLNGVDTAEIYGVKKESDEYKLGIKHKNFVESWVEDGKANWPGDRAFIVTPDGQGKYGRWVATVQRKCDGQGLSRALADEFDLAYDPEQLPEG